MDSGLKQVALVVSERNSKENKIRSLIKAMRQSLQLTWLLRDFFRHLQVYLPPDAARPFPNGHLAPDNYQSTTSH